MSTLSPDGALVLFSGGQDSATCLAWALDRFAHVETVGFDYRQRHRIELDCRPDLIAALRRRFQDWGVRLGEDHAIDASALTALGQTAMTADVAIEMGENGLPTTFVPGRNLLFLTFAAALAYRRGIKHVVTGVCETDYSGYPDCRDDTIKALQVALNLGMEKRFVLHTPLMWIDKAETWRMTERLGGGDLVALIRDLSHSCYLGDREHVHPWGRGCGACPACELRRNGWETYAGATA
jgi:7-cyano-7-deazaguanine synthase